MALLRTYEAQIRASHRAGLALSEAMWDAQASRRLSPTAGYSVLRGIDEAQMGISGAMAATVGAHLKLKRLATKLDMDVTAFGEGTAQEEGETERYPQG